MTALSSGFARSYLGIGAKLLASAGLLAILVTRMDVHVLVEHAANVDGFHVVLATLALGIASLLGSIRWQRLLLQMGVPISVPWAIRASFAGLFAGQFLPSTVGGDGARLWLVRSAGCSLRLGAASIVLDRVIGLLGVLGLIFGSLPYLMRLAAPGMIVAAASTSLLLASGILAVLLFGLPLPSRWRGRKWLAIAAAFIEDIRGTLHSPAALLALAISVLIQLLVVAAVVMVAQALRLTLPYLDTIGIVSTTVLLSSIPISVNGWGVREGTMIAGFAVVGISQQDALLISVIFGLVSMAATLPGALCWFGAWRIQAPEREDACSRSLR